MIPDATSSELIGASPRVHARTTGVVGLVLLASGSFGAFVASRVLVRDDLAATAANIVESETLYRLGISSGLVMMVAWTFYALLLYRLLRRVDRSLARTMLALVLTAVPIYMLNQVNAFAALLYASDAEYDQVKRFLELHRFGDLVAGIFFGLWLLPLGWLVLKSGFIPKVLGILLMFGSLGYLVRFVQAFFFPGSEGTLWSNPLLVVTHLSELALLLWLLVRGVSVEESARHA